MRRSTGLILLCSFAWVLNVAAAGKSPTVDDLNKWMRKAGAAQQALQKAIGAGNGAEAKAQVVALKTVIAEAQAFWIGNHKDDAVAMGKTVLAKLDVLDKAVSAPALDASATGAAVRDLSTACSSCHRAYRTTDEENNFILKPGSLPATDSE